MSESSLKRASLCLALLTSCNPAEQGAGSSLPADVWAPGVLNQPVETVLGAIAHGSSETLSPWHALEVERIQSKAPAVLGDYRDALLVNTPSHFVVDLPAAAEPRSLLSAIRRTQPHGEQALLCEVFWSENGALRSLIKIQLPPTPELVSEPWHELKVSLPTTAGRLEFVSRAPILSGNNAPSIDVAWQSPWVGPDLAPPITRNFQSEDETQSASQPDVLLLTIDTFRSDALDHAPYLQSIMEQGSLWPKAISPSNWTLPSYGSLFTGLSPKEHGAGRGSFSPQATGEKEERNLTPLNQGVPSLTQKFREAGYATAMFHQSPMLESWTGLANGFEQYVRLNGQTDDALSVAHEWWTKQAGRPRFLVLHLMAPHLPYRFGPEPDPLETKDLVNFFQEDHTSIERIEFFDFAEAEKRIIQDRYFEEVRRMDKLLKPFLEQTLQAANPMANTLFAFHSDHGEELWDAGSFEHGHSFDASVIRVPIALHWPGHISAAIHSDLVPAHGLGASLLAAVGIPHNWPLNLENPPQEIESSMPFYRAESGGKRFTNGQALDRPFRAQMNSGGGQASISAAKQRMLEELGYLASKDLSTEAQEPGDK